MSDPSRLVAHLSQNTWGHGLVGGFAPYPAEHVHDELHARCLVLDDYQRFVARRIADSVRRASNLLRPAEIAFTRVDVPEQVHNRRWRMREGSLPANLFGKIDEVKTNPPARSPDLVEPAGPADPAVSIIALREPDGRLISAYCAYSLHYVGGSGQAHVSADYFGTFCEVLKRSQPRGDTDPPFVALLANGTSGDINNIDRLDPRGSRVPYQRMRAVAEDVAGKVQTALDKIPSWQHRITLDARSRELQLDWRTVEPELLEWAKDVEAQAPRVPGGNVPVGAKFATENEWVQRLSYAGRIRSLAEAEGPAPIF